MTPAMWTTIRKLTDSRLTGLGMGAADSTMRFSMIRCMALPIQLCDLNLRLGTGATGSSLTARTPAPRVYAGNGSEIPC
jgi:hypothetical protein